MPVIVTANGDSNPDAPARGLDAAARLPFMGEIAYGGNEGYKGFKVETYDPGWITQHERHPMIRRQGFKIIDEMKDDPQIASSLMVLKWAPMARRWCVQPTKEGQKKPADRELLLKSSLDFMQGTIEQGIDKVLSAIEYGYSITEKKWALIPDGRYAGKIGLAALKSKKPGFFSFDLDEYDNILALESLLPSQYGAKLPREKFVVLSWGADFENPYGRSALVGAYPYWWAKKNVLKFLCIFLDKYSVPPMIGTIPAGSDQAVKDKLLEMMRFIKSETGIVIPDNVKIEIMQKTGAGLGSEFLPALNWFNSEMTKRIIGAALATSEAQGTGTYAQSKTHADTNDILIQYVAQIIEENIMAEQITRDLIRYNEGNFDDAPAFKLGSRDQKDLKAMSEAFKFLVEAEIVDPREDFIREALGFPEMEPDIRAELEAKAKKLEEQREAGLKTMLGVQPDQDPEAQGDEDHEPGMMKEPPLKRTPRKKPQEFAEDWFLTDYGGALDAYDRRHAGKR